jgi:hypothetical protein
VFSCNFMLFFVGFISLLFCLGFSLHMVLWIIFEVETSALLWFFAVPNLQLSLYSGGCFTHNGLLMEFFCNLHRLVRPWRSGLLIILSELLVITIACCSVPLDRIQYLFLHLYCIVSFGFIVWEPTPVSFLGCLTSSSIRIRSGKDSPL